MTTSLSELLSQEAKSISRNSVTVTVGGEERTFYAKPLRPVDMDTVRKKFGNDIEGNMHSSAICFLLIQKLENEDGSKALKQSDFETLVRIPAQSFAGPVFRGLFGDEVAFNDDDEESHEKRLGNSEKTPNS
jgi:hypothetical protein